jgi:Holliday junction resolvase-like predicted endonuclease
VRPSSGTKAEHVVAEWLQHQGFVITERNWRTKFCEIDIIAETDTTRYFIEVKYRSAGKSAGVDAITPKKLQQMIFAAELYDARHATQKQQRLAAVTVDAKGAIDLIEVE